MLEPLVQFHREYVKNMKECRRTYERLAERYDAAVQRFFALSKQKEASGLREDAFQLFDIRRTYICASMDYTAQSVRFKLALDRIVLDHVNTSFLFQLKLF